MTTPKEEEMKKKAEDLFDDMEYMSVNGITNFLLEIRREAIAEVTKQIEEFAHKEMKDGNWAYEKLLILLKTFYI